ncbi:MAG: hypothetical protein A3F84_00170 [Candidatus Handelsmanbacteria bacterium RIFCSPLOWO2_12_FULL_64_10]|uniref:Uncharacterized protein n=1 Tax=Handelsmanbacteria sp. (strain RIFCSPLOWO2_12_FULL_64_10) TaxID=1817868 RepID=A0A1F6D6X9_HANXR|nr:MAG: hypothetical protein A3F84_00170 [Candidatus Handelsmanbacteria bacterium RIFCSPLOWO2_12_FULL_64_10]
MVWQQAHHVTIWIVFEFHFGQPLERDDDLVVASDVILIRAFRAAAWRRKARLGQLILILVRKKSPRFGRILVVVTAMSVQTSAAINSTKGRQI